MPKCIFTIVKLDQIDIAKNWLKFLMHFNPNVEIILFYINSIPPNNLPQQVKSFSYYAEDDINPQNFPIHNFTTAEDIMFIDINAIVLSNLEQEENTEIWKFKETILYYDFKNRQISGAFNLFDKNDVVDGIRLWRKYWNSDSELKDNFIKNSDPQQVTNLREFPVDDNEANQKILQIFNTSLFQINAQSFKHDIQSYFNVLINKRKQIEQEFLLEKDLSEYYLNSPIKILIIDYKSDYQLSVLRYIDNFVFGNNTQNKSKTNHKIKFVISTHCRYEEQSMPLLLDSLKTNNIHNEDILVVSGGWPSEKQYVKDGILWHNVMHNSFDYTGLIEVVEKNIQSDYWFLLHDTCVVGADFYSNLLCFDKQQYQHIAIDKEGYTNIGLYEWDFLQKSHNYIKHLKGCNKSRAMWIEQFLYKMSMSTSFGGDLWLMGIGDPYQTGVCRHILHYSGIDIYKFQLNITPDMGTCTL